MRGHEAWIFALVVGVLGARLLADDPLAEVPRDAAAVVVFPNLAATTERLNAYLEKHFPRAQLFSPDDVLDSFDLPRGVVDFKQPVVIVSARASMSREHLALLFQPKDLEPIAPEGCPPDGTIQTVSGIGGKRCLLMRRGTALVAGRRLPLQRFLKQVAKEQGLLASLDPVQQALARDSDVFVYFWSPAWRDRIRPFVSLAVNAMKLGMLESAKPDDAMPDGVRVVADWAADRVMQVVDEMQTLSAAVRFDGKTLELVHHHTFTRNGSVRAYLNSIRSNGLDFGSFIADRRFMAILALDWQVTAEHSFSCRVMDLLLKQPAVQHSANAAQREKLIETVHDMSGRTQGLYMVLGSKQDDVFPLEIVTGTLMTEARRGVNQAQYVQEHSSEIMASFMPGMGYGKLKFKPRRCGEMEYREAALIGPDTSETFRREMAVLYGEQSLLQIGAMDDRHLVFTMSAGKYGVCEVDRALKLGRTLKVNETAQAALTRLPKSCQIVALLDVGEVAATLPALTAATLAGRMSDAEAPLPPVLKKQGKPPVRPGPMIGWGARIEDGRITGRLSVAAADLPAIGETVRDMSGRLLQVIGSQASSREVEPLGRPVLPRTAPRPRMPGRPRSSDPGVGEGVSGD